MLFTPRSTPAPNASKNNNDSFFKSRVQAKLAIGQPGDVYEREADSKADEVVAGIKEAKAPAEPTFFGPKPVVQPRLQQQEESTADTEETVQQKPLAETITPVQTSLLKGASTEQEKPAQLKPEQEEQPVQQKEEETATAGMEETVQRQPADDSPALKPFADFLGPVQTKAEPTAASGNAEPSTPYHFPSRSVIQQQQEKTTAKEENDTEEEIQEKPAEEAVTQLLQASADDENSDQPSDLSSRLGDSKGGGSAMDASTQQEMSSGFGADFSNVRIHTDTNAVQMNNDLGAQAFASGNDIYFNEGKYNPQSDSGKHLLAHELTHTVQQGASPKSPAVQKSPAPTTAAGVGKPASPIDITHRFELTDAWAQYLDAEYASGKRRIQVDVKIGDRYTGVIEVNKKRGTASGETAKYELVRGSRRRYLDINGWNFLDPLRANGIFPILVLNNFDDTGATTGFLSVRNGDTPLLGNVNEFLTSFNRNLDRLRFLGLRPLEVVSGLENKFEAGRLVYQISALKTVVDGYLEAGGGLGITGDSMTFNANARVSVAGLAEGEFMIARGEDGKLSGSMDISADIANVTASIHAEYIDGVVTIQGTGRINSEKFSGEITLLVTDAARSTQMMHAALGVESMDAANENPAAAAAPKTKDNQVLAGWGEVTANITPWLTGTAKVGIDNQGHVTIVGEIRVPNEIQLMEQRGKKVDLFKVEIRAGYGIPLVGQVFLFASIGMFVNAGFGPLVLKNVAFTGTYSTDPNVLQNFSVTGTLGINAFAVLGLEAEAGVGITIIGHDVKAGVNVTAAAGLRAYAEATPTLEYAEQAAPAGGKTGETRLKGHFEAAAQLFMQLSGALFYELDSPWWSPAPDGREEFPLGSVQYPIGNSMGIGADMDWVVGSPDIPEVKFSPVEFDPNKFTADVMADPPPRRMGDSRAEPPGRWQDGNPPPGNQTETPQTRSGNGLPQNGRRQEDLRNLPNEQKYMRALDELSRLETASPKPTFAVVTAKANAVKAKYGLEQVRPTNKGEKAEVYVKHAQQNNRNHLLEIPLMSEAERLRLLRTAMTDLTARSNRAAGQAGTLDRSAADALLTEWKQAHPVIEATHVVDGGETWDYFIDIGDRNNTDKGKRKKETAAAQGNLQPGDGEVGKVARFDAEGHAHRIWIRVAGSAVEPMVASTPITIHECLTSWNSRFASLDEAKKPIVRALLNSAQYLYDKVKNEAVKANQDLSQATAAPSPATTAAATTSDNTVETTQDSMIRVFKSLFEHFGDSNDEAEMYLEFDRNILQKTHLKAHKMLQEEARPLYEANKTTRSTNKNKGFTAWSGLVDKLKEASRTKTVLGKPITNTEEYGVYAKNQLKRAADKALPTATDAEKTTAISDKTTGIEANPRKLANVSLRDQLFDRNEEPITNERLEAEFKAGETTPEHTDYKVLKTDVTFDGSDNGVLTIKYKYKIQKDNLPPEEHSYTVTMRPAADGSKTLEHVVQGDNIAVKEPGTRGRTDSANNEESRQSLQNSNRTNLDAVANLPSSADDQAEVAVVNNHKDYKDQVDATTIQFNASHLLADWFTGTGYKAGLNLLSASEYYNKKVMFPTEKELQRRLTVVETAAKNAPNSEVAYMTFNMKVKAKWLELVDSKVFDLLKVRTQDVPGETTAQRTERFRKIHEELAGLQNPVFCQSVEYKVEKLFFKDKSGKVVEERANPGIFAEIGQDNHLKSIIEKM